MVEEITKQIEEQMQKAWCDNIIEKMSSNPPDFDYVIKLYVEVKNKLTYILKKESKIRKDIEECMDEVLFKQMITTGSFNREDFVKLSNFVFDTCVKMGSPARDKKTNETKEQLQEKILTSENSIVLIPIFFLEANKTIDNIYEDIRNALN